MSKIVASSRDIHRFRTAQDRFAANPVFAPLDGAAADEVDLSTYDTDQLVFHRDMVEQAPFGIRCEAGQHVDVAVGAEVIAQHRPEQRKLDDLPASAELGNPLSV